MESDEPDLTSGRDLIVARLPGLSEIYLRRYPKEIRQEAVQNVALKVQGMLTKPYLLRMLKNENVNIAYRQRRGDPLPDDDILEASFLAEDPGPSSEKAPQCSEPLVVVEELLRILYGNTDLPLFKLLPYAYWAHLGYSPKQLVDQLAACSIRDLARQFVSQYVHRSDMPADRIERFFGRFLETNETALLESFWLKPDAAVEDWTRSIASLVREKDGTLVLSRDAPAYQRLTYLLTEHLRLIPGEVVPLGGQKLKELVVYFENEMVRRGHDRDTVRQRYGQLMAIENKTGERYYRDDLSPYTVVQRWLDSVSNRLYAAQRDQEKQGLAIVFQLPGAHRTMSFLCTHCLEMRSEQVEKEYRFQKLLGMADSVRERWAKRWNDGKSKQEQATPATVERWFDPLTDLLDADGIAGAPFSKYLDTHTKGGAHAVSSWRAEVTTELRGQALPILFAYRWKLGEESGGTARRAFVKDGDL